MNPIEAIRAKLQKALPNAKLRLTAPASKRGVWTLDATNEDHNITITWQVDGHYKLSKLETEPVYGEGADEELSVPAEVVARSLRLLTSNEQSAPPLPAMLARLRERNGWTQSQLASAVGVTQATISGIERRHDIQISTLQKIVAALGGSLQITVAVRGETYVMFGGEHGEVEAPLEQTDASFPALKEHNMLPQVKRLSRTIQRRGALFSAA